MQRYFSHNFAGFFNVPVIHRHGTTLLYGDTDTPPHLVAFYDTLGIRRAYSRLKPPASSRGRRIDDDVLINVLQYSEIKLITPLRENTCQSDYGYMCIWTDC